MFILWSRTTLKFMLLLRSCWMYWTLHQRQFNGLSLTVYHHWCAPNKYVIIMKEVFFRTNLIFRKLLSPCFSLLFGLPYDICLLTRILVFSFEHCFRNNIVQNSYHIPLQYVLVECWCFWLLAFNFVIIFLYLFLICITIFFFG